MSETGAENSAETLLEREFRQDTAHGAGCRIIGRIVLALVLSLVLFLQEIQHRVLSHCVCALSVILFGVLIVIDKISNRLSS